MKVALLFLSSCTILLASVRSGRAQAEWLTSSKTSEAGKPVQTALRLVLDDGWHTYWTNPGDAGMKLSVEWELPPGWTVETPEFPAPLRFKTGDLSGFGYQGTVVFPVVVNPPASFSGEAILKGKFSWLTCNNDCCVPGSAELELSLSSGPMVATNELDLIKQACLKIPKLQDSWLHLGVAVKENTLALRVEPLPGKTFDPNEYEIFPATPNIIDPGVKPLFVKVGEGWESEVSKCEYAKDPIKELTLVFTGKSGQPPISLTWKTE